MNKGLRASLLIQLIAVLIIGFSYLMIVPLNILGREVIPFGIHGFQALYLVSFLLRFTGVLLLIGGLITAVVKGKQAKVRTRSAISLVLIFILMIIRTMIPFFTYTAVSMDDYYVASYLFISPFSSFLMTCIIFLVGMPLMKLKAGKFTIPAAILHAPLIILGPASYLVVDFLPISHMVARIIGSVFYAGLVSLSLILLAIGFIYARSQLKRDLEIRSKNIDRRAYANQPTFG